MSEQNNNKSAEKAIQKEKKQEREKLKRKKAEKAPLFSCFRYCKLITCYEIMYDSP